MFTVAKAECLMLFARIQSQAPHSTTEERDFHFALNDALESLAVHAVANEVVPTATLINKLRKFQLCCKTPLINEQQLKILELIFFKLAFNHLLIAHSTGECEVKTHGSKQKIYSFTHPQGCLLINTEDMTEFDYLISPDMVESTFEFDVSRIPFAVLEKAAEFQTGYRPLFQFFFNRGKNNTKKWLDHLINLYLEKYKLAALNRTTVVPDDAPDPEKCNAICKECLSNAYVVAQKALELFPDDPVFPSALKRIKFIARMEYLRHTDLMVSLDDYRVAKENYDQRNYTTSYGTNFIPGTQKNAKFYTSFKDFLSFKNKWTRATTEEMMITLFKPLEVLLQNRLATSVAAQLTALALPENYVAYGGCRFVVAPEGYAKIKKNSALREILEEFFVAHGFLPEGVFARFVGFVGSHIANQAVQAGNLFLEHADFMAVNVHGKLTHVLQLYLMLLLNELNFLHKPECKNELELVADITRLIDNEDDALWLYLLDVLDDSYSSPYRFNEFLLTNAAFKLACPLMHGYILDSYYSHQIKGRETFVRLRGFNAETYSNLQFVTMSTIMFHSLVTPRYAVAYDPLEKARANTAYTLAFYTGQNVGIYFKKYGVFADAGTKQGTAKQDVVLPNPSGNPAPTAARKQ